MCFFFGVSRVLVCFQVNIELRIIAGSKLCYEKNVRGYNGKWKVKLKQRANKHNRISKGPSNIGIDGIGRKNNRKKILFCFCFPCSDTIFPKGKNSYGIWSICPK